MKKVFAAFAASAVAVSMLAFAGCGGTPADDGAIKGNYTEKTPEQITEIVDKIDTDKIFDSNATTMEVKVDLAGGFNKANVMSADGSLKFGYKLNADATGFTGAGLIEMNGKIKNTTGDSTKEESVSFNGSAYNTTEWIYAASGEDKVKINLQELIGAFEEEETPDVTNPVAFLTTAEEDSFNIMTILAMAQQFDVKVTIDDENGYKFKLSACEETVWKALLAFGEDAGITAETVAEMKESITFNTFKFDVYFALDAHGAFSEASIVMDVSLNMPMPTSAPEAVAEADAVAPTITANVKGFVSVSLTNETVTVPDTVTGDASYLDMTDTVIGLIKGGM